jgi:hypothetical protein
MPAFTPNQPITTRENVVLVEQLTPGRHRFQLVIVDSAGQRSAPAVAVVQVIALTIPPPTPPLTPGGTG